MSKIKSPQEKKNMSLTRDRRNTYGENSKSSRKNIPGGKQRTSMKSRRRANEILAGLKGNVPEEVAVDAELLVKSRIIQSRRKGFKKVPDTPLGEVLQRKPGTRRRGRKDG